MLFSFEHKFVNIIGELQSGTPEYVLGTFRPSFWKKKLKATPHRIE